MIKVPWWWSNRWHSKHYKLFQGRRFKDYEIIVLGHSLGANLMARIANKSNQISK
jgi:hypothetical protein